MVEFDLIILQELSHFSHSTLSIGWQVLGFRLALCLLLVGAAALELRIREARARLLYLLELATPFSHTLWSLLVVPTCGLVVRSKTKSDVHALPSQVLLIIRILQLRGIYNPTLIQQLLPLNL